MRVRFPAIRKTRTLMKRLYIKSQGCQMNVYDTDRLADLLQADEEMELVDSPEEADLLLLNTCAIREKAQEKMFSEIGRWNQLKKADPSKVIGVGGCVAAQEGSAITKRAPWVDLVFGPQTLHRVPDLLQSVTAAPVGRRIAAQDVTFPEIEKFDHLPPPGIKGPEGYVSIMEGCGKYCSYCVVPYTRGEEISRPFDDILAEVRHLVAGGVREIHLLGQNVNAYSDKGEQGDIELADLIHAVAAMDQVARIRFTTSHPLEMSDCLIDCFRTQPKLVGHLHLPVQSGSDSILAAMKRGYDSARYLELVHKLRHARPGLPISSDFIVGYPGESEEDHQATLALIHKVDFDVSFSFIFSARPGTPAAELDDTTPLEVKKRRLQEVQQLLNTQADRHAQAMLGSKQTVLISDFSKKNLETLQGRTENNRQVHIDNHDPMLIGRMVECRITRVFAHSLAGELLRVLD